MLAERLTQPLSKKLLWSLILVSVGSDVVLYLTRFSYLAETLYTNILLFGIIVGIKLAPRLSGGGKDPVAGQVRELEVGAGAGLSSGSGSGSGSGSESDSGLDSVLNSSSNSDSNLDSNSVPDSGANSNSNSGANSNSHSKQNSVQGPVPTAKSQRRKLFSVFTKAFFLFYVLNLFNNIYISESFTAFDESSDLIAEDFSNMASEFEETPSSTADPETESTTAYRAFEWIDTVGFDFFDSFIAGLEEVWRLSYIVLFLALSKKIFPKRWQRSNKDSFLILAIILSSFLFGVGHSLAVEQEWTVFVGTVVNYTNMGLILGYLLISTRNLWLLVFIHGLYNVLATISWHYMTFSLELFVLLILTINWLITNLNRQAVIPTNYAPQNRQA